MIRQFEHTRETRVVYWLVYHVQPGPPADALHGFPYVYALESVSNENESQEGLDVGADPLNYEDDPIVGAGSVLFTGCHGSGV